jgi:HlyD family secretion protein
MKIFKRILIVVLLIALAVGGVMGYQFYNSSQSAKAATKSIETATLAKGEIATTIDATGKVRSKQTATVNWGTSGQVEAVKAAVGDSVKSSQVLATLAQTSLSQSIITAQATLVADQQALEDLTVTAAQNRVKALANITTYEASVKEARYNLENYTVPVNQASLSTTDALTLAKKNLETASKAFDPYRYASETDSTRKTLLEKLNDAQADYNSAVKRLQYEYNLQVAQANLDQAWSDFNKYKTGPDPKDIAAAEAKIAADQAALNQAMIKAPFDATITDVFIQPGDQVTNATAAFRLDNLAALYVDVDVSEVDIQQVQVGQPVTVTLDAYRNKSYTGKVTAVSQISTDTGSSVNFTVTVQITNADTNVHPGMTAEVKIITARQNDVVMIPLQAVLDQNGTSIVYKVQSSTAPGQTASTTSYTPVTVTLGLSTDSYGQLASGNLSAGDVIVLNPDQVAGTLQTSTNTRQGMGLFGILGGGPGAGGPPPGAGGPPPDQGGASSGSTTKSNSGTSAGSSQP